jgi:hypothetical protein
MEDYELEAIVCATLASGIVAAQGKPPAATWEDNAVTVYEAVRKAMQAAGGPVKPLQP